MEDIELKNIWADYDRKIEQARVLNLQSWALNLRCFETIQVQKAQVKLNSLVRFKVFAVILGIIWALFLGVLLYGNHLKNLYFSFSVGMLFVINLVAIAVYIKHIVMIRQINYSNPVTQTQKQLSDLQLSTFRIVRICMLTIPFYCTWFWNTKWIMHDFTGFWLIAFPIALLFALLAIFIYRNLTIENMDKKWVRLFMMSGPDYKSVVKAKEFLAEVEDVQKDTL